MRTWPILFIWIAQNYEAALIAIARRAVDTLAASDGTISSVSDVSDLPALVTPSTPRSIRDDVLDVEDEEFSDGE